LLLPVGVSFTFTAAIAFFLAAAGAFAFARELGCRESAAAIAAAGYAFCSGIALYILWPLGFCWTLFPFVLLTTHRVAVAPSAHAWGLLTTAFTLLLLAGHGESALHVVSLCALYGAFAVLSVRRHAIRAILTAAAAGITALALSAIHVLPHLDVLRESAEYLMRWSWRGEVIYDTPAQALATFGTNFFPFLHVRRWIEPALPAIKGESAAVGSIVLALAIYAIARVRTRTKWFFVALSLICFAAHASWRPMNWVFAKIPGFDMALNDRLAFGAAFSLVILAALGAEELARREEWRRAAIVFAIVLALLAAGTFWISRAIVLDPGPADWGRYKIAADLGLLALAIAAVAMAKTRALPVLVALILLQRTISDGGVHASFPGRDAYPRTPLFAPLDATREPFRIAGIASALTPNTSAVYELEDVRGYEAMTFAPYHETYRNWCVPQPVYFNRIDDLSKPFLSLMNVRFAFANSATPVPPGWRVAARDHDAVLLENPNALPRAFVPNYVSVLRDRSYAITEMANVTDFREKAWITADGSPYERVNGPGRVTIRRADAQGYDLDADMQNDGWIVVTSTGWKGWRAYVDGKRVQLQPANAAFLSVHTPPGRHRVRLVYWPEAFVLGRAISFVTLLLVAGGWLLVVRRRFANTIRA
ncbi:MAG TPA: YfhO family protein, partial [Thermoanaerobaculia bacterium]|nr:YfhO family protein [Thermoanaerobaculia bacterium]